MTTRNLCIVLTSRSRKTTKGADYIIRTHSNEDFLKQKKEIEEMTKIFDIKRKRERSKNTMNEGEC